MLENLLKYLENKKILIVGFGKEGEASYFFLRKHFPEKRLAIADKNMNLLEDKKFLLEDINVEVSLGEDYFRDAKEYDLILKTPGISLKDIDISSFKDKITSQLELLLEFVPCFTIGITGTKGKSTTSSLIYTVLKEQGKDAMLLGNIGEPIFRDLSLIKKDTILVLELSSHSLEYVKRSPNIAILLDIYEEHLDHYISFNHYIAAKFNISKFQTKKDNFIFNATNKYIKEFNFTPKENDYAIFEIGTDLTEEMLKQYKNYVCVKENRIYCNERNICDSNLNTNLKGTHNLNNILFVMALVDILKLDFSKSIKTIENFKTLEHRMEFVAEIDGIKYYNDSIATIPEATINAIKALKNVNTLIVGGKDRGVDLSELYEFLKASDLENIICLPKTGEYIFKELENSGKNCYLVNDLKDAVSKAKKITRKDSICLLSPAASSYGYFKNFEERGNLFKKYVLDKTV